MWWLIVYALWRKSIASSEFRRLGLHCMSTKESKGTIDRDFSSKVGTCVWVKAPVTFLQLSLSTRPSEWRFGTHRIPWFEKSSLIDHAAGNERSDRIQRPSRGCDHSRNRWIVRFLLRTNSVLFSSVLVRFDNMYPSQIASVLDALEPQFLCEPQLAEMAANCIAHEAHQIANDKKCHTPFAIAARKAGYTYNGGKMDDITVIISIVATSQSP